MALLSKITPEQHAALAPHFKPEYVARDGSFILDVTEVGGLRLDDGQQGIRALQVERGNVATLKAQIEAYGGITAEEATTGRKKVVEMATWTSAEKLAEAVALKTREITAGHQTEMTAAKGREAKLNAGLQAAVVRNTAQAAIAAAKGNAALLLPHVLPHMAMVENAAGQFGAIVIDLATGQPRLSVKNNGQNMEPAELLDVFRQHNDFAAAFDAGQKSGTGAPGGKVSTAAGSGMVNASAMAGAGIDPAKLASGELTIRPNQ